MGVAEMRVMPIGSRGGLSQRFFVASSRGRHACTIHLPVNSILYPAQNNETRSQSTATILCPEL